MGMCMTWRATTLAAAGLVLAALTNSATWAQQETEREITQIAGDLYRFQNKYHHSVFLVTPEGVIVTDPINAEAATWLKGEIERRFDQPIKYLIYSHDHIDHIDGGEVFTAAGAVVVAHENAKQAIIRRQWPMPVPQITFSDAMTIELGGKTVELSYAGESYSQSLIVMRFPEEKALFTADLVTVKRLPFETLEDSYLPQWIDAIRRVEAMDFQILVPGHGRLGTKADAGDQRAYLEDLYAAVLEGVRKGMSLEEMQDTITLDDYKDWIQYEEWRAMNIEGMYRQIRTQQQAGN
jgi:glyoxylase-like metal-dependent hydrolase (beta-lactamase superfamily II)